jgi:NitT/TauT family transport system permease protein
MNSPVSDSTPASAARIGRRARSGPAAASRRTAVARIVPWALVTLALATWEWAARAGQISTLLYPAPSSIGAAFAKLATTGALGRDLSVTLARVAAGFVAGGGVALLLGFGMGLSRTLRLAIDPLVAAAHPVPRLALLPLIFLVFGLGESARIVCVAISCFFPMLINTTTGVRQVAPLHLEVARSFGANWRQRLRYVVVPGSLPSIAAGTRLALVSALRTAIGIELLAAPSGLGHRIWFAWERFATAELYAALATIAVLGFTLNWTLQRWVARFQTAPDGPP